MGIDFSTIDNKLNDPAWYATNEYHDAFKTLRDEDRVHWAEDGAYGRSFWAITRHEDVKAGLRESSTFSSRHMWSAGRVPRSPKRLTPEERFELGLESRVNNIDDPMHNYFRRPINKHFSVPAIGKLRTDIQRYSEELVDAVRGRDGFDLVDEIAAQLPIRVVLRMLGVPEEDWHEVKQAAGQYTQGADPRFIVDNDPQKTAEDGLRKLIDYLVDLAKDRLANPRDDFATVVSNLQIEGRQLSLHEIRGWFTSLVLGGVETSRNAIGTGIWRLIEDEKQRELFLSNPSYVDAYAEEVIRWTSPARSLLRVASRDVELHGKDIRAGDWVVLYLASANKDERVFEDPHVFDMTRAQNDHVGVGDGIHKCLGRNLVRLELGIITRTVLEAFPNLHVAGDPDWINDAASAGLGSLPVKVA